MKRGIAFILKYISNAEVFAIIWDVIDGKNQQWYVCDIECDSDEYCPPSGLCSGDDVSRIWVDHPELSVFFGTFWSIKRRESVNHLPRNYDEFAASNEFDNVILCIDFKEIFVYIKNQALIETLAEKLEAADIQYEEFFFITEASDQLVSF